MAPELGGLQRGSRAKSSVYPAWWLSVTPVPQPTASALKSLIRVIYAYASLTFRGCGIPQPLLSNVTVCRYTAITPCSRAGACAWEVGEENDPYAYRVLTLSHTRKLAEDTE